MELLYPFERFSESAKEVLTLAQREAERADHSYIGTEHLLLGVIEQDGLGGKALKALGLNLQAVRDAIDAVVGRGGRTIIKELIPTSQVKRVIEIAFEEAQRERTSYVGSEHLLVGLMIEGQGIGPQVLADMGVTVDKVRSEVERLRAAGMVEQAGEHAKVTPRKRRHFELAGPRGGLIEVDLAFPADYSDEDCKAVTDGIKAVFPGPKP